MHDLLVRFAGLLRKAGVPVSIAESLDGARALSALPVHEPEAFREALAAAMVKEARHRDAFDALFDHVFCGVALGEAEGLLDEFREMLRQALEDGDRAALERLAARLAKGLFQRAMQGVGAENAPGASARYLRWQALQLLRRSIDRDLGLDGLLDDLERQLRQRYAGNPVLEQMAVERLRRLMKEFTELLYERGVQESSRDDPEAAERLAEQFDLEELPFARATYTQLREMQKLVPALARKLAYRISARRRRARSGRLDFRRTIRLSLSTGGVPIHPIETIRKKDRPEVVLLCDVSSSVAHFSGFALALAWCLRQQFESIRSFAFVDNPDEITRFFEKLPLERALQVASTQAKVVVGDGRSDYGRTLRTFREKVLPTLRDGTTLVILGDARNNGRMASADAIEAIKQRVKRIFWLNPEAKYLWDTGDSVISAYIPHCTQVHVCANLKDLAAVIEELA